MAKEKSINPAQAQRKLEKQKALKKGKAEQLARRTERLAHRNPERLQRQADELRALAASGQPLNNRDKKLLEELDRDVKAVRKARDTLGDRAPQLGSGRGGAAGGAPDRGRGRGDFRGGISRGGPLLGKRRREGDNDGGESSDSATESVKGIPMPKDTPPPIPIEFLRRREFGGKGNANFTPLDENNLRLPRRPNDDSAAGPEKERKEEKTKIVKTVYEAAPVVRDLRKEAVSKFMPSVVRQKIDAKSGKGGKLLEPEELERLEGEGYGDARGNSIGGHTGEDDAAQVLRKLEEEEKKFEMEMISGSAGHTQGKNQGRRVQMEEVEDEDA